MPVRLGIVGRALGEATYRPQHLGLREIARAQRPRAITRPIAFPHPSVRWSCTEGKRLLSTSSKSSTRARSRLFIHGTSGLSWVIHRTHAGSVHSSSVVGVPRSASTSPYVPRRCGVGV